MTNWLNGVLSKAFTIASIAQFAISLISMAVIVATDLTGRDIRDLHPLGAIAISTLAGGILSMLTFASWRSILWLYNQKKQKE